MAGCCNDYPNCPGTVYVPIFFPRWRVRFVFYAKHWDDGTSGPKLCYGIWHRTQEEAERHAIRFLDGGFPSPGVDSDLYDIERQQ